MEHLLYVFATVQVKTAHFSLHLLTMLTPHQAFSISETQSVPKICQQMPVCQILKQKEQISMECTNGKNRVFPFVLFFWHCARYTCIEKHMHTHINTAYIHTYVRIYIYILYTDSYYLVMLALTDFCFQAWYNLGAALDSWAFLARQWTCHNCLWDDRTEDDMRRLQSRSINATRRLQGIGGS